MDALMTFAELASYVVTIVGLPFAIVIFVLEQRKERRNEEVEIQQTLSDSYRDFMALVLEHPDLRLLSTDATPMDGEQKERARALFSILVTLFERAYLLTYVSDGPPHLTRHWRSWEEEMKDWCKRADFRHALPGLVRGEDPDFARHLQGLADAADRARLTPAP